MARIPWSEQRERILEWVWPAAVFLAALALTLVVRRLLLQWLRRRARDPRSVAPALLDTIGFPSLLWCLAASIAIALRFTHLSAKTVQIAGDTVAVFVIVSLSLVAASVAVRAITLYGEHQGMPLGVAGLSRTLIRILALAVGGMTLLGYLGVSITPLLTALGVGGLALALALQDTLSNFFAGLHILAERPIFVGDLIRLENGQEGTVTDIGWRTTRVRTPANDMVVVPNTKITSGILVNYNLPDPRTMAEVLIPVAHSADPEQVRRLALEEAAAVEGVLKEPAPALLCDPGVLPTHTQFKLLVHVESRPQQWRVQSEIRLRLLRRFQAEGVPLPVFTCAPADTHTAPAGSAPRR